MRRVEPTFLRLAAVLLPAIVLIAIVTLASDRSFIGAGPHRPAIPTLQVVAANTRAATPASQAPETHAARAPAAVWDAELMVAAPFSAVRVDLRYDRDFSLAEMLDPDLAGRKPTPVNPQKLRELMDRGVVGYASAATRDQKIRAAKLIELAASLGYGPAHDLIARNYPHSDAMQAVVPSPDATRYAFALLTAENPGVEDAGAVFLALVQFAAKNGTLIPMTKQLADELRADRRAHLSYRIDVILGALARVPGACAAIARVVAGGDGPPQDDCSPALSQKLLEFAQSSVSR